MTSRHSFTPAHLLALTLVALLAAYLRFGAVTETRIDSPIRGDARLYVIYALNLQEFGVFSRTLPEAGGTPPPADAYVAPGYPWFLAQVIDPLRLDASVVRVGYLQALLSLLTVLVYAALFARFLSPAFAVLGAFFVAISPHLVNASVYLLTETLFTFALGLLLLAADRAVHSGRTRWLLGAGGLLGLATLVRPTTLLFLAPLTLALLLAAPAGTLRSRLRQLLLLALPFVLLQGAWMARNLHSTGRVSDSALSASFLQHGMYIDLKYDGRPESYGYPYRFDPENDRFMGRPQRVLETLWQRARAQPLAYLRWYLIGKPLQYLAWDLTESVGDSFIYAPLRTPYAERPGFVLTHDIAKVSHWPLIVLALAATALGLRQARRRPTAALLALTLLYFIGFHMLGAPFPRYSLPVLPVICGLAMLPLQQAWVWLQLRRSAAVSGEAAGRAGAAAER